MIDALPTLSWQRPALLPLALVPWLALWWWRKQRPARTSRLGTFIAPELLARLITGPTSSSRAGRVFPLALTLLGIAAAGPYFDRSSTTTQRPVAHIMVVLDISPSMAVTDVAPSRLAMAKQWLTELSRRNEGQAFGLVMFSANAYPALPLTRDAEAFREIVGAADPSLVTAAGSNLDRALELSLAALGGEQPVTPGLILLVSDGELHDHDVSARLQQLRRLGHRLYSVGIGSTLGGPVPHPTGYFARDDGKLVISRLDADRLAILARQGGGQTLAADEAGLAAVHSAISALPTTLSITTLPAHGVALFPLLIAAALALLLWHGLRRPETLALLLLPMLLLGTQDSDAAPWTERQAAQALQQGDYNRAYTLYQTVAGHRGAMGAGAAAYRARQWDIALQQFSRAERLAGTQAERAGALYNQGNSQAQLGRFDAAATAWRRALQHAPGHLRARRNLALLEESRRGRAGTEPGRAGNSKPQQTDMTRNDNTGTGRGASRQDTARPGADLAALRGLDDDTRAMLQQRFAIEDGRTAGVHGDKPW